MIRINVMITERNKETLVAHSEMTGLSYSEILRRLIDGCLIPASDKEDQELTAEPNKEPITDK